jgi:neutral ceramidase
MNRRLLVLACAVLGAGCGGRTLVQDAVLSPLPSPRPGAALVAGFGRADITPPPGLGLAGNGSEGSQSRGHRLRLYARALALSDRSGGRLAIVVTDLPLGSALLHRRVAAITGPAAGIGADRLVVAATHTHAGPGHFFEGAVFNDQGSSVSGFDERVLDSLAHRVARAVLMAVDSLRPARAAWGSRSVWGLTRIRSLPALLRNIPMPVAAESSPATLLPEYRLVDPEMAMLRVDLLDAATGRYRPAGALTIFAMHGTGNAPVNDLNDGDIHGIVARRLERHIDGRLGLADTSFVPVGVHLFANGATGDVSPAWPPQSRCTAPQLAPLATPNGPFVRSLWHWKPPGRRQVAGCTRAARAAADYIGRELGDSAIALFESLEGSLGDDLTLARAFVTLPLARKADSLGVCPEPAVGMSTLVGADDAHSRMEGWRLLGVLDIGLTQGPSSPNPDAGDCQAPKRKLLDALFGSLPNRLFVKDGLPRFAQLTVLRLGDRVIGVVPLEITTTAGRRVRARMLAAADSAGLSIRRAHILGLANGHLAYLTTAEEYSAQYYEGGSTLYGPGEAATVERALAGLTRSLSNRDELPPVVAPPETLRVGHVQKRLPRPPNARRDLPSRVAAPVCSGDTLVAMIRLGHAGRWPVDSGNVGAALTTVTDEAGRPVARDDDPSLELRLRRAERHASWWELRWVVPRRGWYRVRARQSDPSDPVECGP